MQENGELNVAQAVSLAQGLVMQAKVGGLRVVQHDAKGNPVEIPVSYNKIMDGKEKPIQLAAGDIVYVPISKTKAILSSTTTLIGQTAAAIHLRRQAVLIRGVVSCQLSVLSSRSAFEGHD